ncbi:uncharacterized protein STEHIDRAFT_164790 [Stereum hirsutum FP-91666 SS1]|uniref:uncharacterized protein n=1 Tax=Stereum hirsutum (strain FP-91666) TaxID=721885 RepID=UPI000440A506|nr:uncharacterized protein STEHIDRAFT_164790 [Stereum hirsutum FP-91666 SS1]EIM92526.1 hypothetical protein STEHIDRAFT_164790 [Stereum hirsutum FP-91666 SS1]
MAESYSDVSTIEETEKVEPCIITNTVYPPRAVRKYHVVSPQSATAPSIIHHLNLLWHVEDDTCWDSSSNAVFHAATLTCIIKRLHQLKRKQANASWSSVFPIRKSYTYTFVPFALEHTVIHREKDDGPLSPSVAHHPPYDNFPALQHACHPYFVIYSAIQAYDAQEDLSDQQLQRYATLRLVYSLWEDLKGFTVDDDALPPLAENIALPVAQSPTAVSTAGPAGDKPPSRMSTGSTESIPRADTPQLPQYRPFRDHGNEDPCEASWTYYCLSHIPEYRHKSLEEWRVEAYNIGCKPLLVNVRPMPPFVALDPKGTPPPPVSNLHCQNQRQHSQVAYATHPAPANHRYYR